MNRKAIIKAIWASSSQQNVSKEDVYALIYADTENEHMTDCTDEELLKILKRLDFNKAINDVSRGRLSDKQKRYILGLSKELGWENQPERLRGFIKRVVKIDHIDWLNQQQASKVIEGLKNMVKRAEKEAVNER